MIYFIPFIISYHFPWPSFLPSLFFPLFHPFLIFIPPPFLIPNLFSSLYQTDLIPSFFMSVFGVIMCKALWIACVYELCYKNNLEYFNIEHTSTLSLIPVQHCALFPSLKKNNKQTYKTFPLCAILQITDNFLRSERCHKTEHHSHSVVALWPSRILNGNVFMALPLCCGSHKGHVCVDINRIYGTKAVKSAALIQGVWHSVCVLSLLLPGSPVAFC